MPALYFVQVSILGTTLGSPEDFRAMLEFVAAHGIASLSGRSPYTLGVRLLIFSRVIHDSPDILQHKWRCQLKLAPG